MSDNIRINTLDLIHAYFATQPGKVVEAALGDTDMREKCFEATRAYVVRKYFERHQFDLDEWREEIQPQVEMCVREFVDQWESVA